MARIKFQITTKRTFQGFPPNCILFNLYNLFVTLYSNWHSSQLPNETTLPDSICVHYTETAQLLRDCIDEYPVRVFGDEQEMFFLFCPITENVSQ